MDVTVSDERFSSLPVNIVSCRICYRWDNDIMMDGDDDDDDDGNYDICTHKYVLNPQTHTTLTYQNARYKHQLKPIVGRR